VNRTDHELHPIYALWAVPRSVSTAFERMCMERGDLEVLHEPFSLVYYHGPQARNLRWRTETDPAHGYPAVRDRVLAAALTGPVFFKDMVYHVDAWADDGLLSQITHSFLIRHPRLTLASMRAAVDGFTEEELGFSTLLPFIERVQRWQANPPIIDAGDLCRDPPGTVEAWCEALGLPYLPDALSWEVGLPPKWQRWAEWHQRAAQSRGFSPPRSPESVAEPEEPRVQAMYARCLAVYRELHTKRLSG